MVKIFLLGGNRVKVKSVVRVEGDLRSSEGISCFDSRDRLVGRFVGGELIGFVIKLDDDEEDENEVSDQADV